VCDFGTKSLPVNILPGESFTFKLWFSANVVGEFDSSFDLYIDAGNRLLVETVEYRVVSKESSKPETSVAQATRSASYSSSK